MSSTPVVEHAIVEHRKKGADDKYATHGEEQQEEHEVSVVTKTNAIVDPWTVVVHLQHTAAADAAVVATLRLQSTAMSALLGR